MAPYICYLSLRRKPPQPLKPFPGRQGRKEQAPYTVSKTAAFRENIKHYTHWYLSEWGRFNSLHKALPNFSGKLRIFPEICVQLHYILTDTVQSICGPHVLILGAGCWHALAVVSFLVSCATFQNHCLRAAVMAAPPTTPSPFTIHIPIYHC